ncbi:alpha-(1,3)-fucosyltransferase 11-like [Dysidea avara]|uniref:alpha-(1,3)-fucosyltransferase 11-like n=1 Tax=Dysidea avara TaxID=196820 RepID=UPI0033222018
MIKIAVMWPARGRFLKAVLLITTCASVAVVWVLKGKELSTETIASNDGSTHRQLKHKGMTTAPQNTRKERPQKECPPRGRLDSTAGSNNMCRDQTKLIIYSKLYDGFPVDRFRGYQKYIENCTLPNGVQCVYTEDDDLYRAADVLYVHDCFSYCKLPAYPGQIVIRYNLGPESRPCTDSKLPPSMDIRVSYKTSVTIPMLYLCLPRIKHPVLEALRLDPPKRRHGIAMFVSDCRSWRNKYLEELMKYVKIDSYGRCLHNTVMLESRKLTNDSNPFDIKIDLLKMKRYKFLISFENTVTSEYITEKIWHGYLSQTIPIYYGAPEVYKQVPGNNTFIDAAKFNGPKNLAQYIKKVDGDEKLYRSFFNFDIPPFKAFQKKFCVFEDAPLACDMCSRVYQIKQNRCSL